MSDPAPSSGSEIVAALSWVATVGVGLLTTVVGFLWRQISRSEEKAIATAIDVRRETFAVIENMQKAGAEREQNYRERLAERDKWWRDEVEKIRSEVGLNQRTGLMQHEKMMDLLAETAERIAAVPTRDEVRQDRNEMEARLVNEFRSKRT